MREKEIALIALAIFGLLVASGPRAVFAQGDFTIEANPTSLTVQPTMTGTSNITVASGFSETVALAINNTIACSLSKSSLDINPPASNSSILSCTSPVIATVPVNVTGTSGTFHHSVIVTFFFRDLVNLDGNSISRTDVTVSASANQAKSFRIGAIVNATALNPLNSVYAWQFAIEYNATAFTPQGDPDPASLYPDGAADIVFYGAQNTAGTANWQAMIIASLAFVSSPVIEVSGESGRITVGFAILSPNPAKTLTASTLLANVNFELVSKSSNPQTFRVTNVIFLDNVPNTLPAGSGPGATETITNDAPLASFTVLNVPEGDSSCVPVTGSNCTPYAFTFDATSSSDVDGTIADPAGYFWDFGDGTQDLATTGPVVVHDYIIQGQFNVSLRVQDNLGATGSARDYQGSLVLNTQPSHVSKAVVAANGFFIVSNPAAISIGPNSLGPLDPAFDIVLTSVTTGFQGNVALTTVVSPSGPNAPTVSFNVTSVLLKPGGSNASRMVVSVSALTPHVTTNVTIIGTVGSISNNITVTLVPSTLKVQPKLVTSVASGGSFTVDIVGSAAGLFAWQFQINYNPAVLSTTLTSISYGSFWQNALNNNNGFQVKNVNQTAGYVLIALTLLSTTNLFNGNGTLASITFQVNTNGVSSLRLSNAFFLNTREASMPFLQVDGVFCNISCRDHDVAVQSLVSTPSAPKVGDTVTLTATLTNNGLNPENVTVTILAGTTTVGQQNILIYPGDTATLTFQWDTTGVSSGAYSITAQATVQGSTDENISDNSFPASVTLDPAGGGGPDLLLYIIIAAVAVAVVSLAALLLRRRKSTSIQPTTK